MAKELPYWKFYSVEWMTGDITLCSMKAQGLFINICAFYWVKDGDMYLSNVEQRFNTCSTELKELLDVEIIKVDEDNWISISFLDEQFSEFGLIREQRRLAGIKSGVVRSEKLNISSTPVQQKMNYKEKRREEEIRGDKKIRTKKLKPEEILLGKLNKDPKTKIDPIFKKVFLSWLEYKRERRESYKTQKSTYLAYEKLVKFAGGDPKVAVKILEHSMSNNYAGFFELDNSRKKQSNTVGSRRGNKTTKKYRKPDIED